MNKDFLTLFTMKELKVLKFHDPCTIAISFILDNREISICNHTTYVQDILHMFKRK